MNTEAPTSSLAFNFTDNPTVNDDLEKRMKFLKRKVETAAEQIFDLSSTVSKVIIRRLPSLKDHIPYESLARKDDNGPNPQITILSIGSPRPLTLKKGSRPTHKIALRSGSMCILAGNTSLEYTHSIPRGHHESSEHEQLLLFFIGSPSGSTDRDSDISSASTRANSTSENEATSEDQPETDDQTSQSEIEDISIVKGMNIPKIIISQDSDDTKISSPPPNIMASTDERLSDIISADDLHSPDETDVNTQSPDVTIISNKLTSRDIANRDLSMDSDIHDKTVVPADNNHTVHLVESHLKKPVEDLSGHVSFSQLIEETLIELKTGLQSVRDEVASLRVEFEVTKSPSPSGAKHTTAEKHSNELKKLKDLWQENLIKTSKISKLIEKNFRDIDLANDKMDEMHKHIQKFKLDLKNYYNSAFFKDDSKMIKELHKAIVSTETPKEDWVSDTPQIGRVRASESEFPSIPSTFPARRNTRPAQQDTKSDYRQAPQDQPTRRGPGFSITESVTKLPLPVIQQAPVNSENVASTANRVPEKSRYKTLLITDSILRHVKENDSLGVNHDMYQINKRDSRGLNEAKLRQKIKDLRPDFVYVHCSPRNQRYNAKSTSNRNSKELFKSEKLH